MNLFESVFDLAEKFMQNPEDVEINWVAISKVADKMEKEGKIDFSKSEDSPKVNKTDVHQQLIAGAINYCYWYGKHNIRPGQASSGTMFRLVKESSDYNGVNLEKLVQALSLNRFPLLEERVKHLNEIFSHYRTGSFVDALIHSKKESVDWFVKELLTNYPGYASDMFLKRASLFFLMLYRSFGWFDKAVHDFPVPADYQVPKALSAEGCIIYSSKLDKKICDNVLIPKGSREECEIRAATIIACREIQKLTGWSISDVDGWFWLRRHEYDNWPFHLTITTDY